MGRNTCTRERDIFLSMECVYIGTLSPFTLSTHEYMRVLTKLLFSGLVADGGSEVDHAAVVQFAAAGADEHAKTGLLEDVDVMVVGVTHRPAARVTSGVLLVTLVDVTTVTIRPLLVRIVLHCLYRTEERQLGDVGYTGVQSLWRIPMQSQKIGARCMSLQRDSLPPMIS